MGEPRQLATVNGYQGLVAAIRARKDEMRISDNELEDLAGLTRGHVSKLLAAGATKVLGPLSMGRLLRALGLELIVAENAEQTAKIRELYTERNETRVRKRAVLAVASIAEMPWLITRKNAAQMALKRAASLPPKRRAAIARKAARARWRQQREARAVNL